MFGGTEQLSAVERRMRIAMSRRGVPFVVCG